MPVSNLGIVSNSVIILCYHVLIIIIIFTACEDNRLLSKPFHHTVLAKQRETRIGKSPSKAMNIRRAVSTTLVLSGSILLLITHLSRQSSSRDLLLGRRLRGIFPDGISDPKSIDRKTQAEIHTSAAPNTIVTAFFPIAGSGHELLLHDIEKIKNILLVNDAMVIFTTPERSSEISNLRSHLQDKTLIITMDFHQIPYYYQISNDPESFWHYQRELDPEKRLHPYYESYILSLAKTWFVTEAIKYNPFQSTYYMWADIDSFPQAQFRGNTVINDVQTTPEHILSMAHNLPQWKPYSPWYVKPKNWCKSRKPVRDNYYHSQFYHSGSQMIGASNAWVTFHGKFLKTLQGYLDRHLFIGEGDSLLQSTCIQHRHTCLYLFPFLESSKPCGKDTALALKFALMHGGNYKIGKPIIKD